MSSTTLSVISSNSQQLLDIIYEDECQDSNVQTTEPFTSRSGRQCSVFRTAFDRYNKQQDAFIGKWKQAYNRVAEGQLFGAAVDFFDAGQIAEYGLNHNKRAKEMYCQAKHLAIKTLRIALCTGNKGLIDVVAYLIESINEELNIGV